MNYSSPYTYGRRYSNRSQDCNFKPPLRTRVTFQRIFAALLALSIAFSVNPALSQPSQPHDVPAIPSAKKSVFLEELTWVEVRDALRSGYTTAIIPTGGIEQSGPYLPLGKHNFILAETMKLLAEKLGDTLVAPIVKYVPEGNIFPPSGHMSYPGTISVREETFVALLKDAANSLKTHGFRSIVLLGDSGDNQPGLKKAAAELNRLWGEEAKAIFLPEYYNYTLLETWLEKRGYYQKSEGIHDDLSFTSQLFAISPKLIRFEERKAVGKLSINGVSLLPERRVIDLGREILELRASQSAEHIRTLRQTTSKRADNK